MISRLNRKAGENIRGETYRRHVTLIRSSLLWKNAIVVISVTQLHKSGLWTAGWRLRLLNYCTPQSRTSKTTSLHSNGVFKWDIVCQLWQQKLLCSDAALPRLCNLLEQWAPLFLYRAARGDGGGPALFWRPTSSGAKTANLWSKGMNGSAFKHTNKHGCASATLVRGEGRAAVIWRSCWRENCHFPKEPAFRSIRRDLVVALFLKTYTCTQPQARCLLLWGTNDKKKKTPHQYPSSKLCLFMQGLKLLLSPLSVIKLHCYKYKSKTWRSHTVASGWNMHSCTTISTAGANAFLLSWQPCKKN